MKYEAVVFDLFGTLVPNMSLSEHRAVLTQMAQVLEAPPDDFIQMGNGAIDGMLDRED